MSHQREVRATQPNALFSQGENAAITYTVNWIGRLGSNTISSSTWTRENSGSTVANEANTTQKTSARLSGSAGMYLLTNQVVLNNGDTMEFQFKLRVKDNKSCDTSDYGGSC